jgi:hypothetical protein
MKTVPSKKLVLGALAFGVGLGFLLNIAYHEPWSWHGFVFAFSGECLVCFSIRDWILRANRSSFRQAVSSTS